MSFDVLYRKELKVIRGKYREVLVPNADLKKRQEALLPMLSELPVHRAAFAYVVGGNVERALYPHVGAAHFVRYDLVKFFDNIRASTISQLLTGYFGRDYAPAFISQVVSCCTFDGHLPFGACTSPCISNAVFYSVDSRLSGISDAFDCRYSRYADDLLFSSQHDHFALSACLKQVLHELYVAGYKINTNKTLYNPARLFGQDTWFDNSPDAPTTIEGGVTA